MFCVVIVIVMVIIVAVVAHGVFLVVSASFFLDCVLNQLSSADSSRPVVVDFTCCL